MPAEGKIWKVDPPGSRVISYIMEATLLKRNSISLILASMLVISVVRLGYGKTKEPASNDSSSLRSGTKISAALESAVDAKTAKPGDEVTAKVTHNVKQDGKVV